MYNIDYISEKKYDFKLTDENISPKSKYVYLGVSMKIKHGFSMGKSAVIDRNDYSVIAEKKSFNNYGGTWTHIWSWLGSGYTGTRYIVKDSCGSELSYSEFVTKILQPTVLERN